MQSVFQRIYALPTVSQYYGPVVPQSIKTRFISERKWIRFPEKHILTHAEAANSDLPNVYIIGDPIKGPLTIGLAFNTISSVLRFWDLNSPSSNTKLLRYLDVACAAMPPEFNTFINKRTGYDHWQVPCELEQIDCFPTNTLQIANLIKQLQIYKDVFDQHPVSINNRYIRWCKPSFELTSVVIEDLSQLETNFGLVWDLFLNYLAVKSGKQVSVLLKQIEFLKAKIDECNKLINKSTTPLDRVLKIQGLRSGYEDQLCSLESNDKVEV